MDLILINDSKLKIILTQADMASYALTCENIDYDNTETRRAFWDILDAAKHKTGFDAASERVYVQVYPSKGGGCEMYVTKLHLAGEQTAVTVQNLPSAVFRFGALEEIAGACTYLLAGGCRGGKIWQDRQKGFWYLHLDELRERDGLVLEEFGQRCAPDALLWLNEHCRCVCPSGGVESMAALK